MARYLDIDDLKINAPPLHYTTYNRKHLEGGSLLLHKTVYISLAYLISSFKKNLKENLTLGEKGIEGNGIVSEITAIC